MAINPKLKLFNTMTRKKEVFIPISQDFVRFYSCGQTVYEDVHIGNAKTYVAWDLLNRTLQHFGYKVKHVQNFTDVGHLTDDADAGEDKIEKKAKELSEHPMELVDRQIREYHDVMDTINVRRPNVAPRATGHITEMIDLVKILLEKGYAYNVDNSIYFDTSKFEDYGKLARLKLDEQQVGVREEVKIIEEKRNPSDFALWINAPKGHIMQYSSPWGKGYPGWHAECSVMAMKYLGETIDIHAGGIDHIPVHHTNEIAQSEAATGKNFSNFWLHSEFITLNGMKMSKSTQNFITLRELIERVGPAAARMALTQAHYRTQADFSMEKADSVKTRYDRMIRTYQFALQLLYKNDFGYTTKSSPHSDFMDSFNVALADDLNTPQAISVINELLDRVGDLLQNKNLEELSHLIKEFELMMEVIGIPVVSLTKEETSLVQSLIDHRLHLRNNKNYQDADNLREYLLHNGYILNDVTSEETEWYKPDKV